MLKIITFFSFAIIFVTTQDPEVNEACGSQTTNNNYYYSKDVNPVAGPSVQPPADVLQGRPGKAGPRGFKGDRGDQGRAGVLDNSVVEQLRSELANLTTKIYQVEEENSEIAEEFQRQLNESRKEIAGLTAELAEAEEENNELAEHLQRQLNHIRYTTANLTSGCNGRINLNGTYFMIVDRRIYKVRCEVENDGGNWLVFQRRIDNSVDFYRNWAEYKRGFGDSEGNYWLGLDLLHSITSLGSYQLRVDLEDWNNNTAYALYSSFSVGDESSNYRLSVSGYNGTAGDSLAQHNNHQFSTIDRDNDVDRNKNCAVTYHGAWWYDDCHASNLNGKYQRGLDDAISNRWSHWRGTQSLKRSVMKIRPN